MALKNNVVPRVFLRLGSGTIAPHGLQRCCLDDVINVFQNECRTSCTHTSPVLWFDLTLDHS